MCVIAEKKLQLNSASLYVVVIFIIGGILIGEGGPGPLGPPGYAYAYGYLPPVTVTSDVIGQFYVRLLLA